MKQPAWRIKAGQFTALFTERTCEKTVFLKAQICNVGILGSSQDYATNVF